MTFAVTAKPSFTVWARDAFTILGFLLLWLICVIRLYKGFAHMPLDLRFMYGLGTYLLPIGIYNETSKIIVRWRARAA